MRKLNILALCIYGFLAVPALAQHEFVDGAIPGVREIVRNDDTNPMVYVRDMSPGVTGFVLCPNPDHLIFGRRSVVENDIEAVARRIQGEGCFIANDGWGRLTAVHSQNVVRIQFWWLVGTDFDTGIEERLERSGRQYWAYSYQVGTMGENERVEPIIRSAFE
ncbi:hypothetical protein ROE7235_03692 [Roseibaca ekhonensis]|uniref:Uncharacterized protein n=1 Tax=Roseinatronobacter ekhonensis TaxID=254356 RepID=A0A3B0MDI1_9RHOB|nr:hypothetical protein [Roseibaca ekhonensis]SUZ33911.1 hypothetical protein ROE7235_03692 [Roseibaca ekhonensis]